MDALLGSFKQEFLRLADDAPKLLATLLAVAVFAFMGRLAARALLKILERGRFTTTHRSFFLSLTRWSFVLFGTLLGLNILGFQGLAAGLLAGGGFAAVALGFSFRQVGENLLSGLFLAFNRPFDLEDLIQSGDFVGLVKGIELRNTHVRTFDGRDIYIPSAQIFNTPLVNYTRDGLRRPVFTIGIDYSEDLGEAAELLRRTVAGVEDVLPDPPVEVNAAQFLPTYAELEVSFWIDAFRTSRNFFQIKSDAMVSCHRVLRERGVRISSDAVTNVAQVDGIWETQGPGED